MFFGKLFLLLKTCLLLIYCVYGDYSIGRAVNKFGDDLYKQLAKEEGNIVFSPLSIHSALALITLGTKGPTQKQLLSKLYLKNTYHLKRIYGAELQRQKVIDKSVNIANTLFYDNTISLFKTFKMAAKNTFKVYPQMVSFRDTTQAINIINEWVTDQTKHGITSIVNKESLDSETLLMLLNAVYFKGKWNVAFNHSETISDYIFHSPQGDITCNMMVMKRQKHNHFRNEHFSMLEIAFKNPTIKIAFIKPSYGSSSEDTSSSSIQTLEQMLNDNILFKAIKKLKKKSINIYIPKFKLTGEIALKTQLTKIGISAIFDHPNFSNMFQSTKPVGLKDIDQKTIIEINEDGVVAAAVTKARFVTRSGYRPQFTLDAPFLFVLYDSKNEVILMKGRVENPASVTLQTEAY